MACYFVKVHCKCWRPRSSKSLKGLQMVDIKAEVLAFLRVAPAILEFMLVPLAGYWLVVVVGQQEVLEVIRSRQLEVIQE